MPELDIVPEPGQHTGGRENRPERLQGTVGLLSVPAAQAVGREPEKGLSVEGRQGTRRDGLDG